MKHIKTFDSAEYDKFWKDTNTDHPFTTEEFLQELDYFIAKGPGHSYQENIDMIINYLKEEGYIK